jgi:hypothetical protein
MDYWAGPIGVGGFTFMAFMTVYHHDGNFGPAGEWSVVTVMMG